MIDQQEYYFNIDSLKHNELVLSVTDVNHKPVDISTWSLNKDYQIVTGDTVFDLRVVYSDIVKSNKDHININEETIKQIQEYNINDDKITLRFKDNTFTFEPLKVLLINIHNETEEIQLTRIIRVQLDNNAIVTPTVPESDDNELITLPTAEEEQEPEPEPTPEQDITLGNGLTPYYLGQRYVDPIHYLFFSLEDEQNNQIITEHIESQEGVHTLQLSETEEIQVQLYDNKKAVIVPTTCKVVYDQDSSNYYVLSIDSSLSGDGVVLTVSDTQHVFTHKYTVPSHDEECHIVFTEDTPEGDNVLPEPTVPTRKNILTETVQTYTGSEETDEGYQFHFSIVHTSPSDITQLLPAAESVEQIETTKACLDYGSDYDPVYIELMNAAHSSLPFESRIETSHADGTSRTSVFLDVSASTGEVGDLFTIILNCEDVTSSVGVTVANGSVSHEEQFTKSN